jgi:hypothetical protein
VIPIIDASLQSIIKRNKENDLSAENEMNVAESVRAAIATAVARIHATPEAVWRTLIVVFLVWDVKRNNGEVVFLGEST